MQELSSSNEIELFSVAEDVVHNVMNMHVSL